MLTLTTPSGRTITATVTADDHGRVAYDVDQVGVFTLLPYTSGPYPSDHHTRPVHIHFGRITGPRTWINTHQLPDRPTINRVELCGSGVWRPEHPNPDQDFRWHVRRTPTNPWCTGDHAPAATAQRTADLVHALVDDWLARPDLPELHQAHDRLHAPGRIAEHRRMLHNARERLAAELDEITIQQRLLAVQLAVLGEPADDTPTTTPNPDVPEGQAILTLWQQLYRLQEENGGLPGADTTMLVDQWFHNIGLPLPLLDEDAS